MSRKSKTITIEGAEIRSTELEFCTAADLLADMTAFIAPAGGAHAAGLSTKGEALGRIAAEIAGGRLTGLLTRVLACTTLVVKGECKVDLIDTREKLNDAFTGRQRLVFPAVKLALEVSFKDFLDGLELIGFKMPKLTTSSSEDSSQSTDATG